MSMACLLGVDQVVVELARVLRGLLDVSLGDLVEDHARTGTLGFRTSSRCQAMASPSRSGSVAR